jgi:hypothetical protein
LSRSFEQIKAVISAYEEKLKGEFKDKYLSQVNIRRKDVIRYKEKKLKVSKIEEVIRQIG